MSAPADVPVMALAVVEVRLGVFEDDFAAGRDSRFGCFTADEVTAGWAAACPVVYEEEEA